MDANPSLRNAKNTNFDPTPIKAALKGTWRFPCKMEKSGFSYMHFTKDGRCFELISLGPEVERRMPGLIQYHLEPPLTLRFSNKPGRLGYPIPLEFDGNTLTLIHPGRRFTCTRVQEEEVPGWYRDALSAALSQYEPRDQT